MLAPARLAVIALVLIPVGCSSCSKEKHEESPSPVAGDEAKIEPGEAGASDDGDRRSAAIAVAVWPKHWAALGEVATSLAGDLGVGEAMLAAYPESPWSALAQFGRAAGIGSLPSPPPGLDAEGPVVAELIPPPAPFEESALASFLALEEGSRAWTPGPLVRLTLPADDPEELAGAIAAAAEGGAFEKIAEGPIFASRSALIRITRLSSAVTVDALVGWDEGALDEARLSEVLGEAPTAAPAPAFELDRRSAARLLLRADRLAALGISSGMVRINGALASSALRHKQTLLAVGTSELLTMYLLMDPRTSIAEAAIAHVPVDPEREAEAVFVLSDAGKQAMQEGGLESGKSLPATKIDWDAAIGAAPLSPILEEVGDARVLTQLFHECGWSCWPYLTLGNALQGAHALQRAGELGGLLSMLEQDAEGVAEQVGSLHLRRDGELVTLGAAGEMSNWSSLSLGETSAADSEAATCYRKALVAVRAALKSLGGADGRQKLALLEEARTAMKGARPCAEKSPAIARRYRAMAGFLDEMPKEKE